MDITDLLAAIDRRAEGLASTVAVISEAMGVDAHKVVERAEHHAREAETASMEICMLIALAEAGVDVLEARQKRRAAGMN